MDDKPILHAMVAWIVGETGFLSTVKIMSLEEASQYMDLGFAILVDPADECDLVRWEQWQRALTKTRRQ